MAEIVTNPSAQQAEQARLERERLAAQTERERAETAQLTSPRMVATLAPRGGQVGQPAFEAESYLSLQNQFAREQAREQAEAARALEGLRSQQAAASAASQQQAAQQQRESEMALLRERAGLGERAFTSRLGQLKGAFQPTPQVGLGGVGTGGDETAARAAAFGRAKDIAGQTGRSAIDALQGLLAQGEIAGSGFEAGGLANIIGQTAGGVNEFTREQLIQDLNRAAQQADLRYQGGIQQRGQDLAAQQALLGLLNSYGSIY